MLELYGHRFSSYTMKVLIALYASDTAFEFRSIDEDSPEHGAFVAANGGPLAKFPLLADGDNVIFESTTIIEYLDRHHPGEEPLIPEEPDAAIGMRMLDRLFDNYVMTPMSAVVGEYLRPEAARDLSRCDAARGQLQRSYGWFEGWLEYYPAAGRISLVECAAAPALHYAQLVHPIAAEFPRLRRWHEHLESLPPIAQVIEEAKPWRHLFPVPAPESV